MKKIFVLSLFFSVLFTWFCPSIVVAQDVEEEDEPSIKANEGDEDLDAPKEKKKDKKKVKKNKKNKNKKGKKGKKGNKK